MALLVVAILVLSLQTVQAQGACEENYGNCMAACANERMAERCMQRCGSKRARCNTPLAEAMVPTTAHANKIPAAN